MEQYLVIRLGMDNGQAEWLPVDASGRPLGLVQSGPLEQAAGMLEGRAACVLVPAETMLITRVQLPAGRRSGQWRSAVPYALEDRISEDVEQLHFALGDTQAQATAVVVVARTWMDTWLAALAAAGIEAACIVPDCLALPWETDQVTIALDDGRVLCRDGANAGFSTDRDTFSNIHSARERERGAAGMPVMLYSGSPPEPEGLPPVPRRERMEAGLLATLAPGAVAAPIDLLQGDYAKPQRGIELGPWRLPAVLAAVLAVLALGEWLAGYVALEREYRALQAGIEQEFSRLVPDEPMSNPRAQVERRLPGSRDTGEWLRMLDALSEAAAREDSVQVHSISWAPGSMEVAFTATDASQLDALREQVAAHGLAAGIDSATSRGDRVDGRLRIGGDR